MNILILGPQGSGKGTQARLISNKYKLFYFESGSFLREMAKKNEVLRKNLSLGKLVPDNEMSSYVTAFFDSKNLFDNILLDGFPRTIDQYRVLKPWLKQKNVSLDLVFVLNISQEETIKRLSARRIDPKTGNIYNLITNPPTKEVDASSLIQREDDKPNAIKKRLAWYKSLVTPLISELKNEIEVFELGGERPIEVIFADIVKIIDKKYGKNIN